MDAEVVLKAVQSDFARERFLRSKTEESGQQTSPYDTDDRIEAVRAKDFGFGFAEP